MSVLFFIFIFLVDFLFGDFAKNAARVADGYNAVGDIVRYDAAPADYDVAADFNARHYLNAAAYPDVVAYGYRVSVFEPCVAPFGICRMPCGIEAAIWRNENVVAEFYLRAVQNYAIVVCKEVFAHLDIIAVIAPKRR